jgi:thiol oxidase
MADLESALHYLLRVELATHNTLGGEELKTFKSVVTVIAKVPSILCVRQTLLFNLCLGCLMCVGVCVCVKLYPGRASVQKVMENLLDWLVRLPLESIPYQAILDLVDDKMRVSSDKPFTF